MFKLNRIVLSCGLGGKTNIPQVKQHFDQIMQTFTSNKSTITKCKKANAKWKIRKGNSMGLKLTLRKAPMLKLAQFITRMKPSFSYDNGSLRFGVKDHRIWRLEKYNPKAPEYGFNVNINFSQVSSRIKHRRINSKNYSYIPSKEQCEDILCGTVD